MPFVSEFTLYSLTPGISVYASSNRDIPVAFPLPIGSDFQLVTADVHAAPPARVLFAGVEEVNYA
jgi:hypothetical protein